MHLQTAYDHLTCSIMPSSFHHRETLPITSVCTQWRRLGNNQGYTSGCTMWTWAHPWSQNVVVFTRVSHGTLQTVYGHLTCSVIHYSFHHRQTLPITSVISVCTQWSRLGNDQGYTCGNIVWIWSHPCSQNVVVFTVVFHANCIWSSDLHYSFHHFP